jgi:hypothetical protein
MSFVAKSYIHSRFLSSTRNSNLFRIAFCVDKSFSLESFVNSKSLPLSHPNSKHFVSGFIDRYNQRPYNYNDIGEFELILAPTIPYQTSQISKSNEVFSFPDKSTILFDKNQTVNDVYPVLADSKPLPENKKQLSLQKKAIVHLHKEHHWERAQQLIKWVQSVVPSLTSDEIYLAKDIIHGQSLGKWDLLLLPSGQKFVNILSKIDLEKKINNYKV